ncbi:hypothetical protein Ddye_027250 [Dipteronia dyeriana]|uniref:Disease resistance RPP13-like protein 1 n=1 Tax=Dipteronia dyeriana TaxID=168575 RepID=A0AAD9TNR7_9ROSI|nr:hypothetical protein Ddye_027250 [Dipteronia dyeriana]
MPVVELLISAFLPALLERLTCPELLQFLRQEGLYSKIKKWEKMMLLIQAVLADAEEKQLTNTAVKTWLDDLRDLAYDAEDMLDEFATEAFSRKLKMEQEQQQQQEGEQASKDWKLVPAFFSNWKFSIRMKSNVKDVTRRFDQLCKLRQDLGLKVITGGTSSDAAPLRPPTSSHRIEPAVYGRDEDKKKILEMVLNDVNFLVIPIVGMGGVGKTTLAREVFNDSKVESFEVKAWVCVSDGVFDVTRISKSILENITGSSSGPNDLDTVQNELKHKVNGKKFILVLDDVWSIDYGNWEILQSPFKVGALGSRIIVTTRLQDVALKITPSGFHPLGVLSNEDCWSLFSMCAFENNEAILAHRDMKLIRENVIEKSKGLPLAAKTLGSLLRSKHIDEWLKILNSALWDLSENDRSGIPAALKLSYHHLPSHLKRCFAYCAIFPKDYEFEKEELVLLWMAEGLLQQSTDTMQPEDFGGEYVYDLLSRSLFQQSSSNNSKYVMHDLVHDLAQWGFGEISLRLDNEMSANKIPKELQRVRHFSYAVGYCDSKSKFEVFQKVPSLRTRIRTFLPISQYDCCRNYITNMIVFDMLPKLKTLRALSLRTYHIIELPNSIGGLKHLRYLNLAYIMIRSLPESTTSLYNLQTLLLTGCEYLKKLPSNFRNLINLRHLDIRGARSIAEMPVGLKELKSLQKLSDFILGKNTGSTLKDLKSLEFLRGELCISRLNNVIDCDLGDLVLRDKMELKDLLLVWQSKFGDSCNEVGDENILDMLRPRHNLQKLTIKCYGGKRFPPWVGDPSFSKMTVLNLERCDNCTSLPSFGRLSSLKDLTIKGMKKLKILDYEISGVGCSKPFQSLETLYLGYLQELEHWEPIKGNEYASTFPCLHELSIICCPKLSGRMPDRLPSLEKLVIKNCEQLIVSFSSLPMLCELAIDGCKGLTCNSTTDSKSLKSMTLANISEFGNWLRQQNLLKVECLKLKITGCEQLFNFWQLNETFLERRPQGLQSFISVTELQIENLSNLISFPEVCFLINLSTLEIINCNALTSLPKGLNHKNASLGSLKLQFCNSLTFIVRDKLPSSLKKLEVENCEKLEYLWDDNEKSCTSVVDKENPNNTNTSHLEYLHVKKCPSLKCLSSSGMLLETLQHLYVEDCSHLTMLSSSGHLPQTLRTLFLDSLPELESIAESFHNNKSLEEITVSYCRNLKSIPEGLYNLIHLRKIEIYNCESIDCLGEEGPPNTNLSEFVIGYCEKLKALPSWFHGLNSLKSLRLLECPNMTWFSEEGFPANVTSLGFDGEVKMKKAVLEWGLHNLTSLTSLWIRGFPQQEMEMTFPPCLTHLRILDFPNLKCHFGNLNSLEHSYISGCQNLTSFPEKAMPSSLKSLWIKSCPNLKSFSKVGLPSSLSILWIWECPQIRSFPEQGLPSSLLELMIKDCPKLKEECKRDKGKEWSKISHIPCVDIDGRYIYDPEEESEESEEESEDEEL